MSVAGPPIIDLKAERLNRGFGLRQLAREIGVPEQTIRRAEGGGGISPSNAKRLADFFGRQVTDIWPLPRDGVV